MRSGYSFGVTIQVRLAVAGCLPEEEARSSSPVHIICKMRLHGYRRSTCSRIKQAGACMLYDTYR